MTILQFIYRIKRPVIQIDGEGLISFKAEVLCKRELSRKHQIKQKTIVRTA